MNQQPVIKGWILHGINNERAEIKAVCGTAATSHESGRVLFFLSLPSTSPRTAPRIPRVHHSPTARGVREIPRGPCGLEIVLGRPHCLDTTIPDAV